MNYQMQSKILNVNIEMYALPPMTIESIIDDEEYVVVKYSFIDDRSNGSVTYNSLKYNDIWLIYKEPKFEESISNLLGFPVRFTEEDYQEDGRAVLIKV